MEEVSVHSVTYGDESALVVVTKPARGRTKIEHWFNGTPSKAMEVLLADRPKIERLINAKPT